MNQNGMQLSLKDTKAIKCEECESEIFNQVALLRRVSRFVTGTPDDQVVPIPVFACAKCGHVNKEFLPELPENNK